MKVILCLFVALASIVLNSNLLRKSKSDDKEMSPEEFEKFLNTGKVHKKPNTVNNIPDEDIAELDIKDVDESVILPPNQKKQAKTHKKHYGKRTHRELHRP